MHRRACLLLALAFLGGVCLAGPAHTMENEDRAVSIVDAHPGPEVEGKVRRVHRLRRSTPLVVVVATPEAPAIVLPAALDRDSDAPATADEGPPRPPRRGPPLAA